MIEYTLAQTSDYENINAFYNRLHNSNRTIEQFKWEFDKSPDGGSIYIVAKDDNKVVGTQGVILINLINSDGDLILTGKSEDTLVDPDYRGKNIFYDLYKHLFEECKKAKIQYIWGFTTAVKPFKKMGFEIPYSHEQTIFINQPISAYKYLVKLNSKNTFSSKFKILGMSFLSKAKNGFSKFSDNFNNYHISEEQIFQEDTIINSHLKINPSLYSIDLNDKYIKWRLDENPNFNKTHRFSLISEDNIKVASFYANINKQGAAYISNCIIGPELDDQLANQFIAYCSKQLFKKGAMLIRNWNFTHNSYNLKEIELFNRSGYMSINKGVPFVWKSMFDADLNVDNFIMSRLLTEGTV